MNDVVVYVYSKELGSFIAWKLEFLAVRSCDLLKPRPGPWVRLRVALDAMEDHRLARLSGMLDGCLLLTDQIKTPGPS